MSGISYRVTGGLSEAQLQQLHETALRVLEEVGVEAPSEELRGRVAGQDGIRIDGTRVRFDAALVDRLVRDYRARNGDDDNAPPPFSISILTGYAFRILDRKDDAVREMTTADCVDMAKLVDGLHDAGVNGGTPGMPQDVPVPLREVLAYKIGCENSRTAAEVGYSNYHAAETIRQMAEVAGRGFSVPLFVIDPLRVDGDGVGMALDFVRAGKPVPLGFSSMPLQGLTSPIQLPGAFVSNVATVLGAYSLFACMGIENPLHLHFDVYPMDIRTGSIAYGTPEHVLMYLMGAQVNRFYGAYARTAKPYHTNAVFPDAHSLVQRSAFASAAALAGAREFTFGGMLGVDKVFSAEQLLIDIEIMRYVERMTEGIQFDLEALSFDEIAETGPGGSFLGSTSTLTHCRELWSSDYFVNLPFERICEAGRGRLREAFLSRADEIIAAHDFALASGALRELDRIYQSFENQVR